MPCNSIQTSSVNLELKVENKSFLLAALKSLDYSAAEIGETVTFATRQGVRGVFANGKLTVTGRYGAAEQFDTNPIKVAYSHQVLKASAKRFGWTLKKTSENKYVMSKSGF
jgi:hypothetical protein